MKAQRNAGRPRFAECLAAVARNWLWPKEPSEIGPVSRAVASLIAVLLRFTRAGLPTTCSHFMLAVAARYRPIASPAVTASVNGLRLSFQETSPASNAMQAQRGRQGAVARVCYPT